MPLFGKSIVFLTRSFAGAVWFGSPLALHTNSFDSQSISSWILQWLQDNNLNSQDSRNFYTATACTLWIMWKSRNDLIFRGSNPSPHWCYQENFWPLPFDSLLLSWNSQSKQATKGSVGYLFWWPRFVWSLSLCVVKNRYNDMIGGAIVAQNRCSLEYYIRVNYIIYFQYLKLIFKF